MSPNRIESRWKVHLIFPRLTILLMESQQLQDIQHPCSTNQMKTTESQSWSQRKLNDTERKLEISPTMEQ